jgi:hypothetical protein
MACVLPYLRVDLSTASGYTLAVLRFAAQRFAQTGSC